MEFIQPTNRLVEEMKVSAALRDRRIHLSNEVDRDSIFEVVYFLDRIRSLDDQAGIPIGERKEIELVIDSYGGVCYNGLTLVSKIEELKDLGYKIITTVSGVAMSMGFIISIVGSVRRAYRNARHMIHSPSSGSWGQLQQLEEDVEEVQELWIRLKDIIKKYTKITDEQLEEMKKCKKDWYLWAEEASCLNVVDIIL